MTAPGQGPTGMRLVRSAWFWVAVLLLGVSLAVFGYTLHLRWTADRLAREQLRAAEEFLKILDGIRGESHLEEAWGKILEHQKSGEILEGEIRSLPRPSGQFQRELAERYGEEWLRLNQKYKSEVERIEKIPGGKDFLSKIENLPRSPGLSFSDVEPT